MTPPIVTIRRVLLLVVFLASFAFFLSTDLAMQQGPEPASTPAPAPEGDLS